MEQALVVENLKKSYGKHDAVKGISFEVHSGEIFALIGPNGAGKTTTLRMIATILTPSSGSAKVYGLDTVKDGEKVRSIISYLPEEAGAYKNMSGNAYLRFMADLFTPDRRTRDAYLATAAGITGLSDRLNDRIGTYSKGMTRKLLLARAMMTRPKLAILDEPTSGLDVVNALEIRRAIKDLAKEGMAVLVSSHNMLEIEYLCDRVAIIDRGMIHRIGTPAELKTAYQAANLEEVFMEVVR